MEHLWTECSWMERWLAARWGTGRLQVAELDAKAQRVRATGLTFGANQVELCLDELQTRVMKDHLAAAVD